MLAVRNRSELQDQVVAFTKRLGFETVSATVVIDHLLGEAEFITIDNTPPSYRNSFEDLSVAKRDPVMQHCKRAGIPIIWNQDTYVNAGQAAKWEEQARFGYHTGIAIALHLPEGRHFFVGVDRDQPLPNHRGEVDRMTADLCLFASHAQDAALRILLPSTPERDIPLLTPRELECLRWTMEGKTAWELGNILGISEQTAARHVNNATQKLGCVNKVQAAVKALRMNLIR